MIDQQISLILQRRLIDAFEGFSKELRKFCSQEEAAADLPVTVILSTVCPKISSIIFDPLSEM